MARLLAALGAIGAASAVRLCPHGDEAANAAAWRGVSRVARPSLTSVRLHASLPLPSALRLARFGLGPDALSTRAPPADTCSQKFDPNAQPYWIGYWGGGHSLRHLFTDTANGYDPCTDVNSARSSDPCCGVESWPLYAIPLPTEAKEGSRYCTGWPGFKDPYTQEPFWLSSEVGKNTTVYNDSSCTTPHSQAGDTGFLMYPFETFPLGCTTMGGSLYLDSRMYTLVQSGPLTDLDEALKNSDLDGMPLSAYQFRAVFDHSDCSDASPVLVARPLYDPVDAWFGGKYGTLSGSLAMRHVAPEGSDFLYRLGFVSESNASSKCVAASGVYGSFGAESMWKNDASSSMSSAPKLNVTAAWLDETNDAALIAAKPAATLPRRLALDARVVIVRPSGTNDDGLWGGVVLPAGVALNRSIVFARHANSDQHGSAHGGNSNFTSRDDGNVVKIYPAGTNSDTSVNGAPSSLFALRRRAPESPNNAGVSPVDYHLNPGEAASFVVCTVVGWGGTQTAPLADTDAGFPAADATQWNCSLFQDPTSAAVMILANTPPESWMPTVGMFSTAFEQHFTTGAWGPAGSYFAYFHSPHCSGAPAACVAVASAPASCARVLRPRLAPASCARVLRPHLAPASCARVLRARPPARRSRANLVATRTRTAAQLPPRDGGARPDGEQRRIPHWALDGMHGEHVQRRSNSRSSALSLDVLHRCERGGGILAPRRVRRLRRQRVRRLRSLHDAHRALWRRRVRRDAVHAVCGGDAPRRRGGPRRGAGDCGLQRRRPQRRPPRRARRRSLSVRPRPPTRALAHRVVYALST